MSADGDRDVTGASGIGEQVRPGKGAGATATVLRGPWGSHCERRGLLRWAGHRSAHTQGEYTPLCDGVGECELGAGDSKRELRRNVSSRGR